MDDFPGLLARDYGFRAQGKAAPMAASKGPPGVTLNYGVGSGGDGRSSSFTSSNRGKSSWNSTPVGNSFLDDENLFRSSGSQKNNDFDGLGGFNDVYGGLPKHSNQSDTRKSSTSLDYDAMFQGINDSSSGVKSSSLPVYDKPVYDDDIFDGVPGMKSTASVNYDDVFTTISSPPQQKDRGVKGTSSFDDVFTSFSSPPRHKEPSMKSTSSADYNDVFTSTSSPPKQNDHYDDLLGNLGKSKPPESKSSTRKGSEVHKDSSSFDDLIPGFGGSSPLKNRGVPETSKPRQSTVPSNKSTSMSEEPFVIIEPGSVPTYESSEIFSDPLEQFNKPNNPDNSYVNSSSGNGVFSSMNSLDDFAKSVPSFSSGAKSKMEDTLSSRAAAKTTSTRRASVEEPAEESFFRAARSASPKVEASPKSEVNVDSADDVWITVSEVPLFTQPTSAPPPSRPPPPRPVQVSKADDGSRYPRNVRDFHHSSPGYQSPPTAPSSGKNVGVSSVDELEEFAMGRSREHPDDRADVLSSEEDVDTNSAAAAMKEAMDRAEAKFKQAREVRERENVRTGRNRDVQEKDEKASRDAQERELREKQERLDREREQREKEEKRLDRERREKEREQTRQVVERAQREARERAAAEARQKAQKVAVEKATAEARERAERAAVQRAQNEARERAAADARERAEKAAKEAKERAAAERVAAEARERAAEARVRASSAREHQQRNDNDLESFFGRPSSAPRPNRTTTSESPFDSQSHNRPAPTRTSPGNPSTIRKASSTTNIVDDLTSIFGGSPSSGGDFPDIDGETEERRRARLERHQRTQERAAKALAEKNERDLQVQRDQAERNRIGESLDVEIKRWSAGKEGNLRALLSTMQYVLWPECGWQPVSLTDLITGASVKKVYRKATLCIHPDKVQQKGANLQQKYIAEKVFDLLKEAWNKFNSEELF